MRYTDMSAGMFIVRTKELVWLRVLSGEICLVDSVSTEELRVRITQDCVPVGNPYVVPMQADDGEWYDVSELVLDANACIAPSGVDCEFPAEVAAGYRNFLQLGKSIKPLSARDAVGHICLLGEQTSSGDILFTKTGLYIVSADENGYVIVYQGYCEYRDADEPRPFKLRVLNLNGTHRQFYPAKEIVSACSNAYYEDCELAVTYSNNIEAATLVASTEYGDVARCGVTRMDLEAAVG